jgi:anti-anti-sigma factor
MLDNVRIDGSRVIVTVPEKFRVVKVAKIKESINDALEKGCNEVLFDFKDTTFIDSTGTGCIVKYLMKLGVGKVFVSHVTNEVYINLDRSKLMEDLVVVE